MPLLCWVCSKRFSGLRNRGRPPVARCLVGGARLDVPRGGASVGRRPAFGRELGSPLPPAGFSRPDGRRTAWPSQPAGRRAGERDKQGFLGKAERGGNARER